MENNFEQILTSDNSLKVLFNNVNSLTQQNKIYITGLFGSLKAFAVKKIGEGFHQILVLLNDTQRVSEFAVELNEINNKTKIVPLTDFNLDSIQEKLTEISSSKNFVLISTYDLLLKKFPSIIQIEQSTTRIEVGTEFNYDDLIEYLNLSNYQREKFVDTIGDFAVRGSIIDFWSYSEKQPCRIEFDGDFIESIRYFDAETQRSLSKVQTVTIASQIGSDLHNHSTIFDYMINPLVLADSYELNNLINKKHIEHVNPQKNLSDIDEELIDELFEGHENEPGFENAQNNNEELTNLHELFTKNAAWLIEEQISSGDRTIRLNIQETPSVNANFNFLSNTLIDYSQKGYSIFITSENEFHSKRLYDLLYELNDELAMLLENKKIQIAELPIKKGFILKDSKLLVLTDYEIFNKPYRTKFSSKHKIKKSKARDLASLKIGDYVVHETFGIGQYAGLETINIGLTEQESIKILYAEGDKVYVNLNYLSLVKKYSSNENAKPTLTHLGSNEWKAAKKKVKDKIKDAARQLIQLYAKRKSSNGFPFSADTIWQKELEASFIYEDTPDQLKVTEEVKGDMEQEMPMDRLVCGDVGFGKTEIAVRAAFKAVNDGKQVAMLVPTTILAEQHYNTFRDRLTQFPVKVDVLSRFASKKEQINTVLKLTSGKVDIVIGTHRLLSKDVAFKDLGLLIIDEEHRFGVMAKEKLRAIRANVDTLTLTATPIPRTLNLSLLGARDLSIMATAPPNRQPIYTKVDKFDIFKIKEWIYEEVRRNGQVYFVHDRVHSIDKLTAYLRKHLPGITFGIAHGQMRPAQLENVIHDFLNKKYNVLVATKIIESGLDIPNVNTIIINRADRFGLAELHQLRGRVGRSDRQAYAYLIVPSLNTITKKAIRRLQAIEEYTELGEGFNLSMRDLEIRGAGNLLGTEQSGAIDSVGFEMYVKLLDETVEELKQDEFKNEFKDLPKPEERSSPVIDAYFEIGIPKAFMPDQADRLSFYTAFFSIININEIDEIIEEMNDRYGKYPPNVERVILAAKLRYLSSIALFERIIITKDRITIILPKAERESYYKDKFPVLINHIFKNYSSKIHFEQKRDVMKFIIKNDFRNPESELNFLISFCDEVNKLLFKIER